MLIPRFTIRGLLISMIVCGVVFVALADAVKGKPWAVATCLAIGFAGMLAVIFLLLFFVASVLVQLVRPKTSAVSSGDGKGRPSAAEPLMISSEEPLE